jgi:hypothetical protein
MKQFFKVLSVFSFILLVYFITIYFVNQYIIATTNPQIPKAKVLIVGDSHTQRAINPSFFSDAVNISQLAEPYVVSFWKLKKILSFYQPDTLILGFGAHNFSELDDFRFSTERWSPEMFFRTYPIERFEYLKTIPIDYELFYTTLFKNLCLFPKLHHNNYIGEYFPESLNKLTNTKQIIQRHFYTNDNMYKISNTAVSYLDSIVYLCKEKKIELILINCPVHKSYKKEIPEKFNSFFEKQKLKYTEKAIKILDYSNMEFPDSCYSDADHLNYKGATIFSKFLLKEL